MSEWSKMQECYTIIISCKDYLKKNLTIKKPRNRQDKERCGMRDVIPVEWSKINGNDFKGTITYTEATIKIFQQKLELFAEILHSINMSFNKCRVVSFKLKKQINVDEMIDREDF